jgi:3'-phosphoadenosine 5'-phosphosulfate sulfotransferase (PAPS reductase)/FAD synthetase
MKIKDLKPAGYNPRKISPEKLAALKKSLEEFGDLSGIIYNTRTQTVIGGHQRIKNMDPSWKIIKKPQTDKTGTTAAGYVETPHGRLTYREVDWPEIKEKQANIAANQHGGEFDDDLLKELLDNMKLADPELDIELIGFDEKEITKLLSENATLKAPDRKYKDLTAFEVDDVIKAQIEKAEKIVFQLSGGRDSTLAVIKILELTKDKDRVAVHVDTGVEFPDLLYFMEKFCLEHDLPFEVIHSRKNFFARYAGKKEWPDSIFRDCIAPLINDPCEKYIKNSGKNCLIIRGGRKKQKTTRSKSDLYNEMSNGRSEPVKLLNPLFYLTDDEYNEQIAMIPVWPGYEKGFLRTACWCCPFQQPQQYMALQKHYPMLWDQMREMALTWVFKEHEGDGNVKRFRKYWDQYKD